MAKAATIKCMLVTGASRGIGAAVALLAARAGYKVAINYWRSEASACALRDRIQSEGGIALMVQADVGDREQVRRLFGEIDRSYGRLDVLVNNAGLLTDCRVDEAQEGLVETAFRTNVFSAFYCTSEAIRRMSTKHGGHGGSIINISSVAARLGGQDRSVHYAATKGALDSFTNALSKEVGREGIRVNAIRPGLIATDIFDQREGREGIRRRASTVPLGRVGTPEEVAEVVLWLASDAASFVHGAFIDVSGGR